MFTSYKWLAVKFVMTSWLVIAYFSYTWGVSAYYFSKDCFKMNHKLLKNKGSAFYLYVVPETESMPFTKQLFKMVCCWKNESQQKVFPGVGFMCL